MTDRIKAEIDKISQMDRKKKIEYFKTYYLKTTIVLFVVLVLFIWFIKDTVFQKELVCSGCVYGPMLSEEEKEILTSGYLDYYDYDTRHYYAAVDVDNMFEGTEQKMDAYSHEMALYAQIAGGQIHYLILDEEHLKVMAKGGVLSDLNDVLPDELIDAFKDDIVTLDDGEGNNIDMAINLKNIDFPENASESYLVFTIARPYDNFQENFIKYLMEKCH